MIWHYPTLKDDRWYPSKDHAWPVSGAYHILQMKETPNSLYSYNLHRADFLRHHISQCLLSRRKTGTVSIQSFINQSFLQQFHQPYYNKYA